MQGIYIIKNKLNNKLYLGSCKDFRKRTNNHKSYLSRQIHHSIKLQRAYNKYGLANFEFIFIEEVPYEQLLPREQYWLDILKPEYNCAKLVGGHNRKITSEEVKKKISLASKIRRKVYKFSMSGELLEEFSCIMDGAKSVGKKRDGHICLCCAGKRDYAYGYRWSYTSTIKPPRKKPTGLGVDQYDQEGNFIKNWSYSELAKSINKPKSTVVAQIKQNVIKKYPELINYVWKVKKIS